MHAKTSDPFRVMKTGCLVAGAVMGAMLIGLVTIIAIVIAIAR